jgi:hypothetical protein
MAGLLRWAIYVATPEEVQAFVSKQLQACEDGTFFAGYNFYAMIAERSLSQADGGPP